LPDVSSGSDKSKQLDKLQRFSFTEEEEEDLTGISPFNPTKTPNGSLHPVQNGNEKVVKKRSVGRPKKMKDDSPADNPGTDIAAKNPEKSESNRTKTISVSSLDVSVSSRSDTSKQLDKLKTFSFTEEEEEEEEEDLTRISPFNLTKTPNGSLHLVQNGNEKVVKKRPVGRPKKMKDNLPADKPDELNPFSFSEEDNLTGIVPFKSARKSFPPETEKEVKEKEKEVMEKEKEDNDKVKVSGEKRGVDIIKRFFLCHSHSGRIS
jgi:hypothetical protein